MKTWAWGSAWIFAILCAINGGISGFVGGMIIGYFIGALVWVAAAYLTLAIRAAVWAGLLGLAMLLLAR